MAWKIFWFVFCFAIGTLLCYMPGIEQKQDEKRKKRLKELDKEFYDALTQYKKRKQKNA